MKWRAVAIVALLAAGAALRGHALGRAELWGDEILFLEMSHPGRTARDVIREHLRTYSYIGHLPAAALLTHAGMRLQGLRRQEDTTPTSARLPSLVLGVLTILALVAWVRRLSGDGDTAVAAAAIAASSFTHIWYSREAYHYAGLLLFAALLLLSATALLVRREDGPRPLGMGTLYVVSALALTFSHPSGGALLVVLAVVAVATAVVWRRRDAGPYVVAGVALLAAAFPLLAAGTGQAKGPCVAFLRFPAWVAAEDVIENLGLGPGLWRAVLTTGALLAGAWSVLRRRPGAARWLVAGGPLLCALVYVGGRSMPHFVRYYLLAWPFGVWLAAEAVAALARRSGRLRPAALGAAVLLLFVNIVPGLQHLYALQGKPNRYAAMARFLDARLPAGAVVVWDGAHALRFIPGFHAPGKPMLFGALPDASPEAYVEGFVGRSLERLRASFPSTAFVEWEGMRGYCALRRAESLRDPAAPERRLRALFPETAEFVDPAYARAVRAGWSVVGGVPRFADDRARRQASNLAWQMNVYDAPGPRGPGTFLPLFAEGQWRLLFSPDGQPLVVGGESAAMTLIPGPGPVAAGNVEIAVVASRPGRLLVSPGGDPPVVVDFAGAGDARRLTLRPDAAPLHVRFTFPQGGEGAFALLSVVNAAGR